jgi:hypothetical protein
MPLKNGTQKNVELGPDFRRDDGKGKVRDDGKGSAMTITGLALNSITIGNKELKPLVTEGGNSKPINYQKIELSIGKKKFYQISFK